MHGEEEERVNWVKAIETILPHLSWSTLSVTSRSVVQLIFDTDHCKQVIDVDSGSSHVVGLTETGRVYVWGRLYRLITNSDSWFKFAVEMPGLRKQQIIDRSVAQYLSGVTSHHLLSRRWSDQVNRIRKRVERRGDDDLA